MSAAKNSEQPNALDHFGEISAKMRNKLPIIVLDYDGTLTPIVARPELALLSEDVRRLLGDLALQVPLAILSGRDRADVEKLVGVAGILYAGSHGFDMAGFGGIHKELEAVHQYADALNKVGDELEKKLRNIPGALVERKKYGVAAHYRQVAEQDVALFHTVVESIAQKHSGLKEMRGKMVIEFQPAIDWNKGKALLWILECLHFNPATMITLYIGDDRTDEDAFEVIGQNGISVCVRQNPLPTCAAYTLKDTDEAARLLEMVLKNVESLKSGKK